jgi:hypothetical protein
MAVVGMFVVRIWCFLMIICAVVVAKEYQQVKCVSKGHIDHYYHFFFNCMVPVVLYHRHHSHKPLQLCDTDLGDMKPTMRAVMPNMVIGGKCTQTPAPAVTTPTSSPTVPHLITFEGFDGNFGADVNRMSINDRHAVANQLKETMPKNDSYVLTKLDILLIGRAPPKETRERVCQFTNR